MPPVTHLGAEATDPEIVAAVLAGDREAFALLIDRHQPRVYRALYWMTGSADQADEATQATFCRAYFALASYKPEYSFVTWLLSIGYNLCRNLARNRSREVGLEGLLENDEGEVSDGGPLLVDPAPTPDAQTQTDEVGRVLWAAVDDLPEEYRVILVMRHVDELSYQEICDLTGLPIGTVKSRLARARQRLAEKLTGVID